MSHENLHNSPLNSASLSSGSPQVSDQVDTQGVDLSKNLGDMRLDELHHVAVQVRDVRRAVAWYRERFRFTVEWLDDTWALLRFANTSLALVVPGEHPPHLAFTMEDAESLGELSPHRDGTRSIYIEDSEGNVVECMDPKSL